MATVAPPNTDTSIPITTETSVNVAVVEHTPSALLHHAIGTVVDAEVLVTPASASLEVQTSLGNLLLTSGLDLAEGDRLRLKIQKLGPQPQFIILPPTNESNQSNGLNPSSVANPNPDKVANLVTSARSNSYKLAEHSPAVQLTTTRKGLMQSVPAKEPIKLDIDVIVKATVLKLGAVQVPTTNQQSYYKEGMNWTKNPQARISNQTAGNTSNMPRVTPQTRISNQTAGNTSNMPQVTRQTATAAVEQGSIASLSVGSQFEVRIRNFMPNISSAFGDAASNNIPRGQIFQGRVVNTNAGGQPIVETPFGQLILDTTSQIQANSKLSIEVISIPGTASSELAIGDAVTSYFATRDWPTLTDALTAINSSEITANRQFINIHAPKVGSQMASNILFYISALRGGDISSWLGSEVNTLLQNNFPDLSARLNEEFFQLARPFNEAPTGDWRAALIPLLNGSQLEFFQMNMRGRSKDANKESDEDTSRFLIDVKLSKLGRIQLDGLIKSKGKRFDLFIRSEKPFAKFIHRDLNNIFIEFTKLTGNSGHLVFQISSNFIDLPLPKIVPPDGAGIVV